MVSTRGAGDKKGLDDKSYSPSKSRAQESRSPSKSWLNPRKRLPPTPPHEHLRGADASPEPTHDTNHKRSQHLKKTAEADENPLLRRMPSRNSPSPRTQRREAANRRPSKFVEGSMNDRVSNIPPDAYIGDEDAMEEYAAMPATESTQNKKISVDSVEADLDAGIDSFKISGMSRFGRALANVLVKPVTAWQKFGGAREAKEQAANAEKSVLQARQLKAEKEYAELKRNGVRGTKAPSDVPTPTPVPSTTYEHVANEARPTPHRDSGIDVDGYCSSSDKKRNSQVRSSSDEGLMPPRAAPENVRAVRQVSRVGSEQSASSLSQASSVGLKPPPIPDTDLFAVPISRETSPRKSSLHFRKPSLQTIKKAKSQIQLPTNKQYTEAPIPSSRGFDAAKETDVGERSPRKQPSRKDIAKQQRLSKKVSDLEIQLEIARRNLKQSIHKEFINSNGSPQKGGSTVRSQKGLKTFSPDVLPSLPSERLLNEHIADDACQTRRGPGVNTSRKFSGRKPNDFLNCEDSTCPSAPPAQLKQEMPASVPKGSRSKKRKSDEGLEDARYEAVNDEDHPVANDAAKKPRLRRSKRNMKDVEGRDQTETKPVQHKKVKPVPPTPNNSPAKKAEALPPLPPAVTVFDPSSIDQAKILSMRVSKNTKVPFGKHIEDVSNLRKEFPTVTESQWAEYLDSLSVDNKNTDHTSMNHYNEPVMTVLGRSSSHSRSVSPVKPPKMADNEPFSTGQISPSRRLLAPIKDDEVLDTSSEAIQPGTDAEMASERASNLRSSLLVKALEQSRSVNDNVLPGTQKEDYVWPEDVF